MAHQTYLWLKKICPLATVACQENFENYLALSQQGIMYEGGGGGGTSPVHVTCKRRKLEHCGKGD